jgi:hypothetical protein
MGKEKVLKELDNLLGKPSGTVSPSFRSPVAYCPCPLAVLRVRRYTFTASPRFKWWVDVCYFNKDDLYIVGTIESQLEPGESEEKLSDSQERSANLKADFEVQCPVPSKIVAFLHKYSSTEVTLPLPEGEVQSPPSMFMTLDPFGGGPFEPVVYPADDDDDNDE